MNLKLYLIYLTVLLLAFRDIVSIGEEIVRSKATQKGEYYIMTVYQNMIQWGDYIGLSMAKEIIYLGPLEALADFIKNRNERA